MARKRTEIRKKLEDLKTKYEELVEIEKEEVDKERKLQEDSHEEITKICEERGFFCGVKLTQRDLLNVIEIAFKKGDETIDIPFALYFKDEEEKMDT